MEPRFRSEDLLFLLSGCRYRSVPCQEQTEVIGLNYMMGCIVARVIATMPISDRADFHGVPFTGLQVLRYGRVSNPPGANPLVAERAALCDRGSAAYSKSLQIPIISSAHLATFVRPQ